MPKLILLALLIIVSFSECPNQYRVGDYTFNINYTTSDCSEFDFINCTHRQYGSDDKLYTFTTNYWGSCLYEACKLNFADLTTDTLKSCDDYVRQHKAYLTGTIVMSSLFGFLLITAILLFFFDDKKYCWQGFKASCRNKCSCCQENESSMDSKASNYEINQSSTILKENIQRKLPQWQPISITDILFKDRSTCSICLENNPFIQLECSHSFHIDCIRAWISIKNTCPECRTSIQATKIITKICEKCYLKKRVINTMQQSEIYKYCRQCSQRIQKVSVLPSLRQQDHY